MSQDAELVESIPVSEGGVWGRRNRRPKCESICIALRTGLGFTKRCSASARKELDGVHLCPRHYEAWLKRSLEERAALKFQEG